jgi:hypothetical protein
MEAKMKLTLQCDHCDSSAITYWDHGRPLCGVHASEVATGQQLREHDRELAADRDLEPVDAPSDTDDDVAALMESIQKSLEDTDELVLGFEAVATRLSQGREAQIDREFVLRNMQSS